MALSRWWKKRTKISARPLHRNRCRMSCKVVSVFLLLPLMCLVVWTQWRLVLLADGSGNEGKLTIDAVKIVARDEPSQHPRVQNELIHRAFFGLGHRLHRSAAAWHLAKTLQNVTHFRFHWESCQDTSQETNSTTEDGDDIDYNVFRYLFGDDLWAVPSSGAVPLPQDNEPLRKMIVIRNDVYGYIKGQLYKDLQLPIARVDDKAGHPFVDKWQSDVQFYQQLEQRYRFRHQVEDFMAQHQFSQRLVVGLHLRAGNGEGMHFEQTGRGVQNETEFVANLAQVMGKMIDNELQRVKQHSLPPLVFLATDTAYLIPVVQNVFQRHVGMSPDNVVVLPQIRLEANQGVTFDALEGAGQKCLDGWQAMVSDMMLLARSDVLVAAKHSTFTQSLPLSLVMERQKTFCEVSEEGNAITCVYGDMRAWLFRDNPSKVDTFAADNQNKTLLEVAHRITLLLPDVSKPPEFALAQRFLSEPWRNPNEEALFRYGQAKIYKKYRNKKASAVSKWNIA